MSNTGAYTTFTPSARASVPIARPTRSVSSTSSTAPSAIFPANAVDPSPSAMNWPPSWSAAISNPPSAADCNEAQSERTCSGERTFPCRNSVTPAAGARRNRSTIAGGTANPSNASMTLDRIGSVTP
jgi:hypothetical protein